MCRPSSTRRVHRNSSPVPRRGSYSLMVSFHLVLSSNVVTRLVSTISSEDWYDAQCRLLVLEQTQNATSPTCRPPDGELKPQKTVVNVAEATDTCAQDILHGHVPDVPALHVKEGGAGE